MTAHMRITISNIGIVLAILFAVYGICILAAQSGSRFYLVWLLLAVVLAGAAWALQRGLLALLPRPVLLGCGVLVLVGIATVVITFAMMLAQFHAAGGNDPEVIIVLGAQVRTDGPSRVLRYRLDTAYDYLQAHPEARCIVSGGQGYNEPEPEAEGMARYLIERGLDADRIQIENQSRNTVQNLQYSAAYLDPATDRVAIVTNNFHVCRSLGLARGAGYQNVSGIAARSDVFYLPNNMLRETCGLLKDWLAGNL